MISERTVFKRRCADRHIVKQLCVSPSYSVTNIAKDVLFMETTETNVLPKSGISRKIIAIILLICIAAGASAWYFLYFTKTPEYSLNIIKDAVEKHDVASFNQHVDLDSLLSRGFDDLLSAMIESDKSMKPEAKQMISGFAQMLKSPITSSVKDAIVRYVETGKWAAEGSENQEANHAEIAPDKIAENTGLKDASYRGIAYSKKDGKTAMVGVTIYDQSIDKESVLDIQMRELDDGTWQVAEISNLKDYFINMEKARNQVICRYIDDTKSIVDKNDADLSALHQKINAASLEEKILFYQNMQEIEKATQTSLDAVKLPEAAKGIADLRKKINELNIKLWQKEIEFLQTGGQKLRNEITGIKIQAKTLDKQLSNMIEKAQNSQ